VLGGFFIFALLVIVLLIPLVSIGAPNVVMNGISPMGLMRTAN
jgi:hypothetical protein